MIEDWLFIFASLVIGLLGLALAASLDVIKTQATHELRLSEQVDRLAKVISKFEEYERKKV